MTQVAIPGFCDHPAPVATIYFVRAPILAVLVACAHPAAAPVPADSPARPADAVRRYTIWLAGSRIGTATEAETWSPGGVTLRRVETMRFLRGAQIVELATSIEVEASSTLVPRRVRWTETAGEVRTAEVTHDEHGWHAAPSAPVATMPAAAVPAELLPLLVRRDGHFEGPVFLPARDFVAGTGRIEPIAAHRLIARLALSSSARSTTAEATIDLGDDGMPERVVDGEGVIELRATDAAAREPFVAVDLIAATSIPIAGSRSSRASQLVLEGNLVLPALPGQRAQLAASGVALELSARLPGDLPPGDAGPDRTHEIAALVATVRGRITPTLAASPASGRDPAAIAGDCTTYALAFAALATSHGIPTRVVTGLRVDGARLVRHRWAVSWTGTRWIAVDATFGAAPAGGNLVGLAVHDADEAGLASGEAALSAVRSASWASPD